MFISRFVGDTLGLMPEDPQVTEVTQRICHEHGLEGDCDLNKISAPIAQRIMREVEILVCQGQGHGRGQKKALGR